MNILFLSYFFVFGLLIGSFLNCLVWRLHEKESLWNRSYCPKCKKKISWFDNIPILSYLILWGRCRFCKKDISCQYPIVEFVTACFFALVYFVNIGSASVFVFDFDLILKVFRDLFIVCVMIVIFIYDLRWYLILDSVTLPACLLVFVINVYLGFGWLNLLISAIIGSSFFLVQFLVSRGKWIGGGDIRVGLLMGVIFTWPKILVSIFLAYLIGAIVCLGLLCFKKKKIGSEVPLGVFLSLSTILVLFFGDEILSWYLDFLY